MSGFTFNAGSGSSSSSGFSFGGSGSSSSSSGGFSFGGGSGGDSSASSSSGGGFSFGSSSSSSGASSNAFSFSSGSSSSSGGSNFSFSQTQTNAPQTGGLGQHPAEFFQMLFEQVNEKSATYRFRTIFYNVRDPNKTLAEYRLPQHTPPALLRQATEGNPDPERLVPVLCEGLQGLRDRVKAQNTQLERQQTSASSLGQALKGLSGKHVHELLPRLDASKRRFEQARARLLRIAIALEKVRASGYALHGKEDELRARFDQLLRDLQQPHEYRARLAELQTRVLALSPEAGVGGALSLELAPDDAARLAQTLEEQRAAHATLMQVLVDDERATDRLARALTSGASGSAYS